MRYTNKWGLPEAFMRLILNDDYDSGGSDFTATSLAKPPRAAVLIERHFDQIEVDISSRVAAVLGQGFHKVAQRAARPGIDLSEERLFAKFEVDGKLYSVSTAIDLFETDSGHLLDWKTTKAKRTASRKPEWCEQLNIGAELLRRNGHIPTRLTAIALIKNWEDGAKGHGDVEISAVELPLWSSQEAVSHIERRIRAHVKARFKLPYCTMRESWGGNRCAKFCDAASFCEQFQLRRLYA